MATAIPDTAPALKIGDTAPDFEAETTEGRIRFHDWIGNSWAVLFSHPKDFTPVCTTELGYMASIKPEFDRRGVKIIGLSVDPVDKHEQWSDDIEETQGTRPNYPMIGDSDYTVSKLYGMLGADASGDLPWDRDMDTAGGSASWAGSGVGRRIGSGWSGFSGIGSVGGGVLFARDSTGRMVWYRDADPLGGSASWANGGVGVTEGTGWNDSRPVTDITACSSS